MKKLIAILALGLSALGFAGTTLAQDQRRVRAGCGGRDRRSCRVRGSDAGVRR